MNLRFALVGSALVVAAVVAASAQQAPPAGGAAQAGGRGQAPAGRGQPTAPPAVQWSTPPAPITTLAIDTGVQHMVWVVPTRGFNQPWSMAFLPDGSMLVTERLGCLRIVRGGVLDPRHVTGLPPVQAAGLAGLMDIALHPQFAQNQLVYFTYHKPAATTTVPALNPTGLCAPVQQEGRGANAAAAPAARGANPPAVAAAPPAGRGGGGAGTITLARGKWDGTGLVDVKDIFSAIPSGNASRIVFGKDGMVYMTVGVGDPQPPYLNLPSQPAQDPIILPARCCG